MLGSDTTTILVVIPVDDVVAAVLDTPMATIIAQHALGIGLLRCFAGYPIGDFSADLTTLFVMRDAVMRGNQLLFQLCLTVLFWIG